MKRLPRWAYWLVGSFTALAIACVVIGVVVVQMVRSVDLLGTTAVEDLPPEKVELAAAITLPPSTRNLHSHYESFQDYFIHVRFEMDAADLPAFVASTQLTKPLSTTDLPWYFNSYTINREWWQPQQAKQFLGGDGSVNLPSGSPKHQAILIDTNNAQTYIVYVIAFDT